MLIIDYQDGFTVDVSRNERMERDEFMSLQSYFSQIHLTYDTSSKKRIIPQGRIDEVCLRFKRGGYSYKLTQSAIDQIKFLSKKYQVSEQRVDRNIAFDVSVLSSNITLFEFQKNSVEWLLKRRVSLNATDTGGGKTLETIAVTSHRIKDNSIDSILIVTPDGSQYNWMRAFLSMSTVFSESDFYIINNENKIKPFNSVSDKRVIIIATHILKDVILSYKKDHVRGKSAKLIRWREGGYADIKKLWDKKSTALVVDESHLFKRSSSIRFKSLFSNKKYFDYKYLLSATPNITCIEDIYSQFKLLDESLIPFSEKAFKLWIADEYEERDEEIIIKKYNSKNVEILKSKFPLVMIQILKKDLPEMKVDSFESVLYVRMHPLQKRLYDLIWEEEVDILQEDNDSIKWKTLENKLNHFTSVVDCPEVLKKNTYKNKEIESLITKWDASYDPKYILLKSKLEDYIDNRDEKMVVFDPSPHVLNFLFDKFKKYNPLMIHGQLKGIKDKSKDRDEKEHLFNTDPSRKLFLLSTHTSSRSINLHKMCHRIIYYSNPWDAEERRQGQDRVYRIVSDHDVYVESFVVDNTIDLIRYERAMNRIQMNDTMMKNLSHDDLNKLLLGIV